MTTEHELTLDEIARERPLLRKICMAQLQDLPRYGGRQNWFTLSRTALFKAWTKDASREAIAEYEYCFRQLTRGFHLKQHLANDRNFLEAMKRLDRENKDLNDSQREMAKLQALTYGAAFIGWSERARDCAEASGVPYNVRQPGPIEYGFPPEGSQALDEIRRVCHETFFLSLPARHAIVTHNHIILMRRPTRDPEIEDVIEELRTGRVAGPEVVDSLGDSIWPL